MNEYASWSIALRSMVKNKDKFQYYNIGKDSNLIQYRDKYF